MGHGLLHQPHASRRGRPLPPRSHCGGNAGRNGALVARASAFARFTCFAFLCLVVLESTSFGIGQGRYVESVARPGSFSIADHETSAPIYVDPNDYVGVVRAAKDLQNDITRVTGSPPSIPSNRDGLGPRSIS